MSLRSPAGVAVLQSPAPPGTEGIKRPCVPALPPHTESLWLCSLARSLTHPSVAPSCFAFVPALSRVQATGGGEPVFPAATKELARVVAMPSRLGAAANGKEGFLLREPRFCLDVQSDHPDISLFIYLYICECICVHVWLLLTGAPYKESLKCQRRKRLEVCSLLLTLNLEVCCCSLYVCVELGVLNRKEVV